MIRSFFVPDSNLLIKCKANGKMICSKPKALAEVVEFAEVAVLVVEPAVSHKQSS